MGIFPLKIPYFRGSLLPSQNVRAGPASSGYPNQGNQSQSSQLIPLIPLNLEGSLLPSQNEFQPLASSG